MYIGLHVKYSLCLSDFNETSNFLKDFRKNAQISNFTEARPVGAELLHVDRQTDGQRVAFGNFANAPTNVRSIPTQ